MKNDRNVAGEATGGLPVPATPVRRWMAMAQQFSVGPVHAPDFQPGLDWLNTTRPLTLHDLRGKIALLDFWTYG